MQRWVRGVVRANAVALATGAVIAALAGCERTGEATSPAGKPAKADVEPAAGISAESAARTSAAQSAEPEPEKRSAPRTISAAEDAQPAEPPRIEFDPPVLDLGYILPNEEASGSVEIRNNGARPVEILSVKPTCKCTAVNDIVGSVIGPGDAVTLEAGLDARSMTGVRTEAVRIVFDGYDQPYTVEVRGEVALPVRISPSIFNLVGGETSGHAVVEALDGKTFEVLAANGRPPRYVGFDPEIDEPRSSYTLKWDLTEAVAEGDVPAWWIVETDHPDCPLSDAWVRHASTIGRPSPGQRWFTPDRRIMLGVVKPGDSQEFTITVVRLGATAISAVRSLSSDFDAELVRFERQGADGLCTIRVTPAPDHEGLLYGAVELMGNFYTHRFHVTGKVE